MGSSFNQKLGLASLLAASAVTVAMAQDDADPTRSFKLTLNNRLSATDNQERESTSAGVTTSAVTRVGFSAITENDLNQLNFSTSTALRFSNSPDDGSTAEIDQPELNLRYVRSGATSTFSISSTYSRDDIEYLSPLETFVDEEGVLVIPDDIDDLDGTGTRVSYSTNLALDLMRDAPVSLRLTLGQSGRNYIDVSDADLNDVRTTSYGASLGFRFDTDFTGSLSYNGSQYRADDSDDTRRDRQSLSFGISKTLSNVLEATASVGWSDIETETNSDGTESSSGANGSIGLTLDRPNGEIGLNFASNTNVEGSRQTLTFRRSLELPSGSLAATVGLTQQDHGKTDTVAGLRYSQTLASGTLSVSFNQSVRYVDEDDAFEQFTSASASHNYQINNLSSLTLRGALSRSEETDLASLGLTYTRAMTTDWNLSTGYNFTSTNSDTDDSADTHQVFVGLSRDFDLPF